MILKKKNQAVNYLSKLKYEIFVTKSFERVLRFKTDSSV